MVDGLIACTVIVFFLHYTLADILSEVVVVVVSLVGRSCDVAR